MDYIPHTFFYLLKFPDEKRGKSFLILVQSQVEQINFFLNKEYYLHILSHDINPCEDVFPIVFSLGFIFIFIFY